MGELVSHYELLNKLGTGGMGTVWRARDTRSGVEVALKMLHPHLASDAAYVARFEREARVATGIESENVVKTLGSGKDGDRYFLVMEYVPGLTLAQLIQRQGALPVDAAAAYAMAVANGLAAAHARGIVHRDVSPQNVIVTPQGVAKVTDFGVARDMTQASMTATSMVLGKPQYLAPEVVTGNSKADIRSDIYSLGIVTYQMLTGNVPFDADTPWNAMMKHVNQAPPPLSRARQDAPQWLAAVVQRCLAKDPRDRYQTPAQLLQAMADRQETFRPVTPTPPLPPGPPVGASGGGRPPFAWIAALGASAAVLVGIIVLVSLAGGDGSGGSSSRSSSLSGGGGSTSDVGGIVATPDRQSPTSTPTPRVEAPNRANCDAIEGTTYLSDAERAWFLANCSGPGAVGGGSVPTATRPPAPTSVPSTKTPVPPVSYSLTAYLDKAQYAPGESITLCYRLNPENVAFEVRVYESLNGSSLVYQTAWEDNGANGGDCVSHLSWDGNTGSRQIRVEAYVGGAKVAQADVYADVVGGGAQTPQFLTVYLVDTTLSPGDTMVLCYEVTPHDLPFQVRLLESVNGGSYVFAKAWEDNGLNGGDCVDLKITATPELGPRNLRVEVSANGQTISAEVSAVIN